MLEIADGVLSLAEHYAELTKEDGDCQDARSCLEQAIRTLEREARTAERERCAKAAERWGLGRQPEYGGTALMNFASELRAGRA